MSSLKETVDAFAECNTTAEDQAVDTREDSELLRPDEQKVRDCLICKSPFPSAWAGERICRRCKSTSAWRSGALG